MIQENQIAKDVRVVLNEKFSSKCLGDEHLAEEKMLYIQDGHKYNDVNGTYIWIKGGSRTTSGTVYLHQIDLEFPISEKPHYTTANFPHRTAFESIQNIVRNFDENDVLMKTPIAYHRDIENLRKMFNITSKPAI